MVAQYTNTFMRFFLEVIYVGTAYAGSQIQKNALSVQSVLEEKIQVLLKKKVTLTGASRTDAGVHAMQNFFHFDIDFSFDKRNFIKSCNALLPQDIAIVQLYSVHDTAHCRYNAIQRHYMYKIMLTKNPFLYKRAYLYPYHLDKKKLHELAQFTVQQKDFGSFSKKHTQVNNFFCEINTCTWEEKNELLYFYITANRFLRGMVRALVSTQLLVACGKMSLESYKDLFEKTSIAKADFSAPADGLYLVKIDYPEEIFQ